MNTDTQQTAQGVQQLRQPSNRIVLQVLILYGVILLAIVAVISASPGLFLAISVLAWATIGWCQFALFNALHEGLHRRFAAPHRHWLCYLLTAYPVGFSENYQQVHLDHHRYFGDHERDPDYVNYANFPTSRRQFLWRLLINVTGVFAVLQFLGLRQRQPKSGARRSRGAAFFRMALFQTLLLLAFSVTIGWYFYIWLWLIPVLTFAKFFAFLRTFCEHASPSNTPTVRTITGSWLGEKMLGVFNFHYHAEHHEYVFVPCNQLPLAHKEMQSHMFTKPSGELPRYEHCDRGYSGLLAGWFAGLPL